MVHVSSSCCRPEPVLKSLTFQYFIAFGITLKSVNGPLTDHQPSNTATSERQTTRRVYRKTTFPGIIPTMPSRSHRIANPKREALQQYWHEGGSTGIYARATLRTLQFCSAIITIGIYGSSLHQRSQASNPITNEIYALVVGLLSVFTLGFHCLFTIKRVPFVLWDFAICVLWAALAGVYGTIYLRGGDLAQEDRVGSLDAMKVGVAFDLLSMVLWLLSSLQGCVWCCRARRFTRKTDVAAEMGEVEASPSDETYARSFAPGDSRASSDESTLYAGSIAQEKENKLCEGRLMKEAQ